eukprot:jgi/Undpi1/5396/HiC_scaffold_2.g00677.m1
MTTVTLFLSTGTSVLMRVCRRTATSSALRWTSAQQTAATSKLSRGDFEGTLSSPFILSPGEEVGSLLAMVREGGGGGSVETTAQRGTSGEALVSKGDRLHSKRGRAEVAMAQNPYGEYELDLDVESFDDEGTTRWTRIAYEIENGEDEYHLWNTLFSHLAEDPEYAPTEPGEYTWPLEGATGYYKTFYAGPLPPTVCENSLPSGTELVGCFEDSEDDRLLGSDTYVLSVLGEDGMTAQICSDFCSDYDFFGLESASECYCGTADEFENAVSSEDCGTSYPTLCTGDATTACGGFGAISVYQRTGDAAPAPAPTPTAPAPSPFPSPTTTPTGTTYSLVGCFADDKTDRIMGGKMVAEVMSAEICHQLCDDGINTHFGTQYAEECVGTASGELCGGSDKITAYKIEDAVSEYLGCYADTKDARAMDAEEKYVSEDMTNEVCTSYCAENGHSYAGTQYSEECWCGDASYDIHGEISNDFCSYPCEGNADTMCGGFYAISVYSTAV